MASIGAANAQRVPLTTFKAGMTPEQAMAVAPQLGWTEVYNTRGDELWEAFVNDAVVLAGSVWNLQVGSSKGPGGIPTREGEVSIKREFPSKRPDACLPALTAVIVELEPIFGAFGTHPDFSNLESQRYYPYGRAGYRLSKIGASSLVRDNFVRSDYIRAWDTFREPQDDRTRVSASVEWIPQTKACELQVSQWIANAGGY